MTFDDVMGTVDVALAKAEELRRQLTPRPGCPWNAVQSRQLASADWLVDALSEVRNGLET